MLWLQLVMYAAIVWAVAVLGAKALRYARAPVHMRWELYPVAHDAGAAHGGSHYEVSEHWTEKAKPNRLNEMWTMFLEIALLKGVWEHNRAHWVWSFPFHQGCYALVNTMLLMVASSILFAVGVPSDGFVGNVVEALATGGIYVGMGLTTIGAAGLLVRRYVDPGLKRLSAPIDYFNLIFFLVLMMVILLARRTSDPNGYAVMGLIYSLVTFGKVSVPPMVAVEAVMWGLMFIYLPLTRMNHFVSKYFTYHQVRWEDEPNRPGSRLEGRIQEALGWGVSWSAPHIQSGKTWGEVATHVPQEESSQ